MTTTTPIHVYARTSGLAVASLVLGILWLGWVGSVLAVVLGHCAIYQVNRSEGMLRGWGLAMAGVCLGWIGIVTLMFSVAILAVA